MTVIRPAAPMYDDVIYAYQRITAGNWHARIDPDPLGSVNRIVRLMNGDTQVRACLAHIPEGATVELVRDGGSCALYALKEAEHRPHNSKERTDIVTIDSRLQLRLRTDYDGQSWTRLLEPPGWRVTVDGETVLAVTDAELRPPYVPPPPPPIWRRARNALRERTRAITDRIAARLGYHRDGECEGEW